LDPHKNVQWQMQAVCMERVEIGGVATGTGAAVRSWFSSCKEGVRGCDWTDYCRHLQGARGDQTGCEGGRGGARARREVTWQGGVQEWSGWNKNKKRVRTHLLRWDWACWWNTEKPSCGGKWGREWKKKQGERGGGIVLQGGGIKKLILGGGKDLERGREVTLTGGSDLEGGKHCWVGGKATLGEKCNWSELKKKKGLVRTEKSEWGDSLERAGTGLDLLERSEISSTQKERKKSQGYSHLLEALQRQPASCCRFVNAATWAHVCLCKKFRGKLSKHYLSQLQLKKSNALVESRHSNITLQWQTGTS